MAFRSCANQLARRAITGPADPRRIFVIASFVMRNTVVRRHVAAPSAAMMTAIVRWSGTNVSPSTGWLRLAWVYRRHSCSLVLNSGWAHATPVPGFSFRLEAIIAAFIGVAARSQQRCAGTVLMPIIGGGLVIGGMATD